MKEETLISDTGTTPPQAITKTSSNLVREGPLLRVVSQLRIRRMTFSDILSHLKASNSSVATAFLRTFKSAYRNQAWRKCGKTRALFAMASGCPPETV